MGDESIAVVQETLTKGNWYFYSAEDETPKKFGVAKFVFDVPNYKVNESLGKYFINYYFSKSANATALDMVFKNNNLYTSFLSQMEVLGYKLKDSKTKDGNIIKIYKWKGKIIVVTIPPNFERSNVYKFLFTNNNSYRKLTDY